jgi:signal transduction histidine kinase/GAF domain-containing protein
MSNSEKDIISVFHSLAAVGLDPARSRQDALEDICKLARNGVGCVMCILTRVDRESRTLTHEAWSAEDPALNGFLAENRRESSADAWLDFDLILGERELRLSGLARDGQGVINPDLARRYSLNSLWAFPIGAKTISALRKDPTTVWYLNFYFAQLDAAPHREMAEIFVRKAALVIKQYLNKNRLSRLADAMKGVTECGDSSDLYKYLLKKSCEFVPAVEAAWVSRWDFQTGSYEVVVCERRNGKPFDETPIPSNQGITGRCLETGKPIRVDDVRDEKWKNVYVKRIEETISELAVPIIIENVAVRVGKDLRTAQKKIGVLNLESSLQGAFSENDEESLWALCRQAAIVHERLESDRKFKALREIARKAFGEPKASVVLPEFLRGITESFGFEYANVSLVKPAQKKIRTEYVKIADSMPPEKIAYYKQHEESLLQDGEHGLEENDIQSDVVRTLTPEALQGDDPRFDRKIYEHCKHEKLNRVFIPIIVPFDKRVLGTLEAGYWRDFRPHIYEEDVQILRDLMEYAIPTLESERFHFLERVMHEFKSPIVGIRSNASFLEKRGDTLEKSRMQTKLADILTDCEILLSNVFELEYILRGDFKPDVKETVFVNRDVILKTLNQLRPYASGQNLDAKKIEYKDFDRPKINVYAEKAKLAQVVFNLVMNAIKYAKQNAPNDFAIRVEVEEEKNAYLIKFKDWGIGVPQALKEKIFEEGFRTQEAKRQDVTGSGLGLSIARKIACENGGDLWLANHYGPTEFHWRLPKDGRTGEK